ncbi:MAG: HD-GYP domain-containing protein [Solirubrobacteraceae bacterium]
MQKALVGADIGKEMELTLEDQALLAANRTGGRRRMARAELLGEALAGLGLLGAIGGLCVLAPPRAPAPAATLLCVLVTVLATRVVFETPFGFTVATQLAFVPLIFALPVALAPLAVAVAMLAARVPDVVAGRAGIGALVRTPANAWFAVGPALVFALAGTRPDRAGAPLLAAALAAQFCVDFAVSAVRCRIAREADLRSQLRDSWVYGIDAALSGVGLAVALQLRTSPYWVLAVVPLIGVLEMFAHERRGRIGNLLELNDTYRGTALLLGDVISADDGYTGAHSDGVVALALAVGEALGLDAERRRNLEFGAMLHDVGKIAVPKEIINKPSKLDPHEWEIVKTHPAEGERMLRHVGGFMVQVGRIVRHHHERWDGGGYPDGLAGVEIPLESRIITCCDSWSAMRTDRAYRAAMSHEAALAQIVENSGSQFDPGVVRALLDVVAVESARAAQFVPVPVDLEAAGPDATGLDVAA